MGVYCTQCNKRFASNYSLKRHAELKHPREESEESEGDHSDTLPSDDENDDAMSVETGSNSGLEGEEDLSSTDEEADHDEADDVFSGMISRAYEQHKLEKRRLISQYEANGASETEATRQAHIELLPKYRKALRNKFKNLLIDMQLIRKHPVYKAVMQKARDLEMDNYERDEAIAAAVSFRKHLINTMIPSEDEESDDDDDDDISDDN